MKELVKSVKADIQSFLKVSNKLFFNECDLQMNLACFLESTKKYDKIHVEYFLPSQLVEKQIKQKLISQSYYKAQNIYVDIVVEKGDEFLPIELKYKTALVDKDICRFGELVNGVSLLKNQGARNLGAYDFWWDVCRVECLVERFNNVNNGLTLFLTNDCGYMKNPSDNAMPQYAEFNMKEGEHGLSRAWKDRPIFEGRPSFKLRSIYKINWNNYIDGFKYCLLEI